MSHKAIANRDAMARRLWSDGVDVGELARL